MSDMRIALYVYSKSTVTIDPSASVDFMRMNNDYTAKFEPDGVKPKPKKEEGEEADSDSKKGDKDEARKYYRKALEIDPRFPSAIAALEELRGLSEVPIAVGHFAGATALAEVAGEAEVLTLGAARDAVVVVARTADHRDDEIANALSPA